MKIPLYCVIVIFLQFLIILGGCQAGLSIIANNPFSMGNAKIVTVKGITPDRKYLVELEYGPEQAKKGQVTFFTFNLFDNIKHNQTRLRHVDCDLTILKDNVELFKISKKYGEPLYHVISGSFLASFPFKETGIYKVSVMLAGINFSPITPVIVNFNVVVPRDSNENLRINFAG